MSTKLIKLCFYDDSEEEEEDNEEENELGCGQNVKKIGEKGDSGVENVNVESEKDTLEKGTEPGTVKDGAGPKRKHSDVLVNGNEFVADCPNPAKKESKARLPLPSALFTSTSSSSTSSSPSSSSTSSSRGRVRSFAHVRGNWASHVFLKPFVNDESMGELSQKISEEAMKVFEQNSLPKVEVHPLVPDDLHLSLSRTFVLAHHLIPSYVSSLREALRRISPDVAPNGNIFLAFSSAVKIYFNDENTRGFIAIQVHPSSSKLLRHLISAVDSTLKEFNLGGQIFYDDPSFHLSLAWFLPPEKDPAVSASVAAAAVGGAKEDVEKDNFRGSLAITQPKSSSSDIDPSESFTSSSSSLSSSTSISQDVILLLEKSLSSVVADHFLENDDPLSGLDNDSSSSSPASTTFATVNRDSVSYSDVSVASAASVVKRVILKTGNKLHSFPL